VVVKDFLPCGNFSRGVQEGLATGERNRKAFPRGDRRVNRQNGGLNEVSKKRGRELHQGTRTPSHKEGLLADEIVQKYWETKKERNLKSKGEEFRRMWDERVFYKIGKKKNCRWTKSIWVLKTKLIALREEEGETKIIYAWAPIQDFEEEERKLSSNAGRTDRKLKGSHRNPENS